MVGKIICFIIRNSVSFILKLVTKDKIKLSYQED